MSDQEIFKHLFEIAPRSKDIDGVVTSCLVRNHQIIADAVSAGIEHAEYELLKRLDAKKITVLDEDTVYVTLQPCDRRTPGGGGEMLGDCTTNLIKAGIKNVVYAASYPKSINSINRFKEANVSIRQIEDVEITRAAVELFNSTNEDASKHLPIV